ncbi:MAG: hypothetical protein IKW83_05340 [Muribaculaceae bacterium]|nr:hypothetical protein [Muribaculaceae bacterium]
MKKVLLLMMAVAMCGIAQAANYEINVGGIEVSTSNYNNVTGGDIAVTSGYSSGYVQYNPNTNTLTLKNITIKRTGSNNYAIHNRKRDNLTIEFIGDCVLDPDNAPGMKLQRNTTIKITGTETYAIVQGNSDRGKPAVDIDDGRTLTIGGDRGKLGFYGGKTTTPAIKGGSSISFNGDCIVYVQNTNKSSNDYGGYCFSQQTLKFNSGCDVELNDFTLSGGYGVVNGCTINTASSSGVKIITPNVSPFIGYVSNGVIYTDSGEKAHSARISSHYVAIVNSDYFPDSNFRSKILNWAESDELYRLPFQKGFILDFEMPYVKSMYVRNQNVYNLEGIQYFTYLETLDCSKNHLSGTLNLSALTKLKELNCSENQVGWLTVSSSAPIFRLDCHSNQLTSIYAPSSVQILNCSSNKLNDLIDFSNRSKLNTLNISNNPNMSMLYCNNCSNLEAIDINNCSAMTMLMCNDCKLTQLQFYGCSALTTLYCQNNQITTFYYLPTSLETIDCSNNRFSGSTFDLSNRSALKSLNVSNNPNFSALKCNNCSLTWLNVKNCSSMAKLECNYNQLMSLDLSGCTALNYLNCEHNKIESLAIANNTALKEVYASYNQIYTAPAFSSANKSTIEILGLNSNKLSSFSLQGFTKLWTLGLADNPNLTTVTVTDNSALKGISIGNCPALTTLTCNNNALVSGNAYSGFYFAGSNAIKTFNCNYNDLTSLDVSSLSNLTELRCTDNRINSLNVSNKTKLVTLYAYRNQLTSINVQGCSALKTLDCGTNKLSSLSVQGCSSLTLLNCFGNQIKESAMTSLINSLRTIPAGSTGEFDVIYPGYVYNSYTEGNVITNAQVMAARNKRWIPKKYVSGSGWVEIPVSAAVLGDVNGDGEVTAADVTALYDFMLTNDSSHIVNGDVNGDGNITAADITAVYDVLLGNN